MTPSHLSHTSSAPSTGPRRRRSPRPDVSVCIVNWNCRAHLRACLRALRAIRDVELEILVVDNASTDGAADMVARNFPAVTLIRNRVNAGFARANNQAARLARGRYLFFLNNDTLVPPGALRRLLDYARAHPEVGILGPCLRDRRGQAQVSCRLRPSVGALLHRITWLRWTRLFRRAYRRYRCRDLPPHPQPLSPREGERGATLPPSPPKRGRGVGGEGGDVSPRPVEVLMGAALFMPRRVFRDCGPWDEDFVFGGEDIDLCTRVARRHAVVYHPGIAITHHGRVSSRRQAGYAYAHTLLGMVRYLRKSGCSRPALLFYKAALTLDAPLQCLCHALQYLWRRARGRPRTAASSWLVLRGLGHFLAHDLVSLWRI